MVGSSGVGRVDLPNLVVIGIQIQSWICDRVISQGSGAGMMSEVNNSPKPSIPVLDAELMSLYQSL